jgi:anti-anti-sigma regulatory factor
VNILKITRAGNEEVLFTVSGRLAAENLFELEALVSSESRGRHMIIDLKDLRHVDRDAVRFLAGCETESIELKNCPPYIREWITRERGS